jgi:hypothetical protein
MGGLVERMREKRDVYRDLVGKMRERKRLQVLGVDGRIILNWMSKVESGTWTK